MPTLLHEPAGVKVALPPLDAQDAAFPQPVPVGRRKQVPFGCPVLAIEQPLQAPVQDPSQQKLSTQASVTHSVGVVHG